MKLVEILAREMEKWPDDTTSIVGQAANGSLHLNASTANNRGFTEEVYERAEDWRSQDVTRADWEAERAKLKALKDNGGGWIRHRGGKCPVEPNTIVIPKFRSGDIGIPREACQLAWSHTKDLDDVMRYKIHKPAEQPCPVKAKAVERLAKFDPAKTLSLEEMEQRFKEDGGVEDTQAAVAVLSSSSAPADTMLAIRDRIRELDTQRAEVEATYRRQISEITQERESLVQKLAGEGLALVGVVVQPVEDMLDCKNWKRGDKVTCLSDFDDQFTAGALYQLRADVENGHVKVVMDDNGNANGWGAPSFKWHSRPAT
jgi:hypothetical protein